MMVDLRKGLDEAGLFESYFRNLCTKPHEIFQLCDWEWME